MEAVEGAKVATDGARRRPPGRLAATSLRLLPDERLARLAADGNRAAFAAIYERHHQALYRYCRTITRNDEDARDALQTTMLKAMKAIDSKPKQVRAWLYRIAHNESISILRSGKRNSADSLDNVEPTAEAPLEERRELRELLDDIGHLSDRQRQALVMRELGGLSYDEVGAALSCSPAAAKQAAFDGRTALYELAEARDTDCESIRKRISDGDRRMLRARGVRAHLRACDPCRRFDAAMRNRQAKLAGLVPALSPAASAAILNTVLGGGGAAAAGAGAGAGAGAVGGGAAASGGGAAATVGGSAVGGGIAMKGVIAGVAALVATGGAIAVKEERDANRGTDSNWGAAVEVNEATSAPATDRSGHAAGAAATGTGAGAADTGGGDAGASANENSKDGTATHSGAGNAQGNGDAEGGDQPPPQDQYPQGQHPQGTKPQGQHPGGYQPGSGPTQPGGQRPPKPSGGGDTAGGGTYIPGGGTRPPGGWKPPSGGEGTVGTRPPGYKPPATGDATTESQRPPKPQATDATTSGS